MSCISGTSIFDGDLTIQTQKGKLPYRINGRIELTVYSASREIKAQYYEHAAVFSEAKPMGV